MQIFFWQNQLGLFTINKSLRTLLVILVSMSFTYANPILSWADDNFNDQDIEEEANEAAQIVHAALNNLESGNPQNDIEHINFLTKAPFHEVEHAIAKRLLSEASRGQEHGPDAIDYEVIISCLNALGTIGTVHTSDIVEEAYHRALDSLKSRDDFDRLADHWQVTYEQMDARKGANPHLPYQKPQEETAEDGLKKVEVIHERLSERIIGQPEVVDRMADLAMKDLVYMGQRKAPEMLFLMGSPGTGKDTAAEAYIDALYGYKGAHEQHMFRLPIMKERSDLWGVIGSTTGYLGSDSIPPFLRFLVEHSAGRYKIETVQSRNGKKEEEFIVENPDWSPVEQVAGSLPPEMAVVFVNEFHNWSKSIKDQFLKQAWEKGYFQVNNPNGGPSELYVPVTFIVATNEGLSLVTSRELNGQRFGEPLTYEQMMEKWRNSHADTSLLKAQLQKSNPSGSAADSTQGAPGISEEVLNRIPDSSLLLLRPLSPDDLKKIVSIKMKDLAERLDNKVGLLGTIELRWSQKLIDFMQDYHYVAEDNARPMSDRVSNLVERTLLQAIRSRELGDEAKNQVISVDVETNPDKTSDLVFTVKNKDSGAEISRFRRFIEATENDRERPLLSDEKLEELTQLSDKIKSQVFGVDAVADRLAEAVLVTEEARHAKVTVDTAKEPARTFAFFGLSSTGKTEVTKVLAEALYGKRTAQTTIDFSQVRSVQDIKDRILGGRDSLGNPIPSEFMKEYDRTNGNAIFVFDEIANAPKDALKALYDVLREPVVTFSDGKARVMTGVTIILTGNAGEEWYQDIPRDVPEDVQRTAMSEIYKRATANPNLQRQLLEEYFSEAFLNRIGLNNTFFFPPLSFKATRELTQLKVMQSIKELKPKEGQRGWNLKFKDKTTFTKLITMVEEHGFVLREQGASIDRFVKQDVFRKLRHELLKKGVPSAADVIVTLVEEVAINSDEPSSLDDANRTPKVVNIQLKVKGSNKKVSIQLPTKDNDEEAPTSDEDRILTAFHEAGHEIVRSALLGDKMKPTFLSIIPGVTNLANRWVYYAGVSQAEYTGEIILTREAALSLLAVNAAGEVAQTLVTKGERHDAGKNDDYARATELAYRAILIYGLSERWGRTSIPPNVPLLEYVKTLSEPRRQLLEDEVALMLKEARSMAKEILELNFQDVLVPLSLELAEKGIMRKGDFEQFYQDRILRTSDNKKASDKHQNGQDTWWKRVVSKFKGETKVKRDAEIFDHIPRPTQIAKAEDIVAAQKAAQIAKVKAPADLPLADVTKAKAKKKSAKTAKKCEGLLKK